MNTLKGPQIDLNNRIPEEVSEELLRKAADLSIVRGVEFNEVEKERITATLFLGAGIALKGRK